MKNKSKSFEKRISNYSLTASLLLASSATLSGQDALPKTITGGATCSIDFDGGGTDITFRCGVNFLSCSATAGKNVYWYGSKTIETIYPFALDSGINVPNTHINWRRGNHASLAYSTSVGNFVGVVEKYLAVKFIGGYGWVKLTISATSNSATILAKDFSETSVPTPLPIELISFSAQKSENNIKINWETASEINNYGFEIERTSTPIAQEWEQVGFVSGHGNSNSPKFYEFIDENAPAGVLEYRLKQIDTDGSFEYYTLNAKVENTITNVAKHSSERLPTEYWLKQNYPNPFNPTTHIEYSIPANDKGKTSNTKLAIFDMLGKEVAVLVDKQQWSGNYSVQFHANKLASGIYYYRLASDSFVETKKMLLMK